MAGEPINPEAFTNADAFKAFRPSLVSHWKYLYPNPDSPLYVPLNSGMHILDFITTPPHADNGEWLSYFLHNLIDRVAVFYDFTTLFCNDGGRGIEFSETLFYGTDIKLETLTQETKSWLVEAKGDCSGRIKVGMEECVRYSEDLVQELVHQDVNVREKFPNIEPDFKADGTGASTYILRMINTLKNLRLNPKFFPRRMNQGFSDQFIQTSRYIIYHLCIIMSHITACHFQEAVSQNLGRHLFTLDLWVYLLGGQFGSLPLTNQIPTEFHLLCRFLWYKDNQVERTPLSPIPVYPIAEGGGGGRGGGRGGRGGRGGGARRGGRVTKRGGRNRGGRGGKGRRGGGSDGSEGSGGSAGAAVGGAVAVAVGGAMGGAVGGIVAGPGGAAVGSAVGGAVGVAIGEAVRGAVGGSSPKGAVGGAAAGSPRGAAARSPRRVAARSPRGAAAGSPLGAAAGSPRGAAAGSPRGAAAGSPRGAAGGGAFGGIDRPEMEPTSSIYLHIRRPNEERSRSGTRRRHSGDEQPTTSRGHAPGNVADKTKKKRRM